MTGSKSGRLAVITAKRSPMSTSSEPEIGVSIKKPVAVLRKPISINYQNIFGSLGKATAHALSQDWGDVGADLSGADLTNADVTRARFSSSSVSEMVKEILLKKGAIFEDSLGNPSVVLTPLGRR